MDRKIWVLFLILVIFVGVITTCTMLPIFEGKTLVEYLRDKREH